MPFQGFWWWVCCRHGFTLLGREYGEKEEEEESLEMSSPGVQMTNRNVSVHCIRLYHNFTLKEPHPLRFTSRDP